MPSQNKTSLGLNQWQGNEYPKREDFNEDNRIIDAKITENTTNIFNKANQSDVDILNSHMADISYKPATLNGREIQLTVPSWTFTNNKFVLVEITADIVDGTALTVKVNSDVALNLKDGDNADLTSLNKGFYTFVAKDDTTDFFLLAPRGVGAVPSFLQSFTGTELTLLDNVSAGDYIYSSEDVVVEDGVSRTEGNIVLSHFTRESPVIMGLNTASIVVAQEINISTTTDVIRFDCYLSRTGSPTDSVRAYIASGNRTHPIPTNIESTNTILGSSLSDSVYQKFSFEFPTNLLISGTGTVYLQRTGSVDSNNYYRFHAGPVDINDFAYIYDGTNFNSLNLTLAFQAYEAVNGQLVPSVRKDNLDLVLEQNIVNSRFPIDNSGSTQLLGQTFQLSNDANSLALEVKLNRGTGAGGNIGCQIYNTSSNLPTTSLYASDTILNARSILISGLGTEQNTYRFTFKNIELQSGITYAFILTHSAGSSASSNQVFSAYSTSNQINNSQLVRFDGTTWSSIATNDLFFNMYAQDGSKFRVINGGVLKTYNTEDAQYVGHVTRTPSNLYSAGVGFFKSWDRFNQNPLSFGNIGQTPNAVQVLNVTGSGWVVQLFHAGSTVNSVFIRLEIDGIPILPSSASRSMALDTSQNYTLFYRFENGFTYYSGTSQDSGITYLLGDELDASDLFIHNPSGTTGSVSTRVNVVGSGWIYGMGDSNIVGLVIDDASPFSSRRFRGSTFMTRFEKNFTYSNSDTTRGGIFYTIDG